MPGYTKAVDLWCIGMIACRLLTGDAAFCGAEDIRIHEPATITRYLESVEQNQGSMVTRRQNWTNTPHRPRSLVQKLLVVSEKERLTAKQALQHPWFTDHDYVQRFEELWQLASKDLKPPRKIGADSIRAINPSIYDKAILQAPSGKILAISGAIRMSPPRVPASADRGHSRPNVHEGNRHPFLSQKTQVAQALMLPSATTIYRSRNSRSHHNMTQLCQYR